MSLKTSVTQRRKGVHTVRLEGRLDTATSLDCEEKLKPLLDGDARTIVFDLEKLEYISSMGLRLILAARKALAARKGRVLLIHPQPQIAKVFEIADILPKTDIFESLESADIFLDAVQRKELVQGQDVDA